METATANYTNFLDFRNKVIARAKRHCKGKKEMDTSCLTEQNWQGFNDDPELFNMAVKTVIDCTNGNEW